MFVGVSEDGRRRRQAMLPTATIDDPNMRSYTFTDGKPFTNYDVRVDGVVELNGEEARVVALTSTPVRTAEGGEALLQCVKQVSLLLISHTLSSQYATQSSGRRYWYN